MADDEWPKRVIALNQVVLAILSYLIGSIPSAYLVARVVRKIDIRRVGTGNVGATNVYRHVGPLAGVLTAVADVAKGMVAVSLAQLPYFASNAAPLVALLCAVIGHNWPLWLGFEGGGGLATFGGGLALLIAVWQVVFLGAVWGAVYRLTRHKYLSSVFMCLLLPVWLGISRSSWEYFTFGLGSGVALGFKQVLAWIRWSRSLPVGSLQ